MYVIIQGGGIKHLGKIHFYGEQEFKKLFVTPEDNFDMLNCNEIKKYVKKNVEWMFNLHELPYPRNKEENLKDECNFNIINTKNKLWDEDTCNHIKHEIAKDDSYDNDDGVEPIGFSCSSFIVLNLEHHNQDIIYDLLMSLQGYYIHGFDGFNVLEPINYKYTSDWIRQEMNKRDVKLLKKYKHKEIDFTLYRVETYLKHPPYKTNNY